MTTDPAMLAQIQALAARTIDANVKQSFFRGCIYGPSGTGKSVLAAAILRSIIDPAEGQIVQVDTSEGYVSWGNIPGLKNGIKIQEFTDMGDLRALVYAIQNKIAPFDNVKGLILDEYSKMTEIDVLRIHEARERGEFAKTGTAAATGSMVPEGWDYQFALARFRKLNAEVSELRNVHIVTLAHQAEKKDRQGNIIAVGPSFSPKIAQNHKEALHLVAHMTAKLVNDPKTPGVLQTVRQVQVHPSAMVDGKCRLSITETALPAEELPGRIKSWLDSGGQEVRAEDVARPEVHSQEELNAAVKDLSPQEAMAMIESSGADVEVPDVPDMGDLGNLFGDK